MANYHFVSKTMSSFCLFSAVAAHHFTRSQASKAICEQRDRPRLPRCMRLAPHPHRARFADCRRWRKSLGKFAEGGREHARAGNRLKYCRSSSVPRHQCIAPLARALALRDDAENQCCVVRSQYCRNRVGPATMPVAWRAALSIACTFRAPLEQATGGRGRTRCGGAAVSPARYPPRPDHAFGVKVLLDTSMPHAAGA